MTTDTAPAAAAQEILRRSRALTEPALRTAVDRLPGSVGSVARYHFGWCDAEGNPANGTWGKGVRGALVLCGARAVGGEPVQAVRTAAAVELVHNFSLLHDDLMDRDRLRRGRRTAWAVHGPARAVLAGDGLLILALEMLTPEQYDERCAATVHEVYSTLLDLVSGQSADLDYETRTDVRLDECMEMAAGKTSSLLAGACALGALAAGAAPERADALRRFGHHIGLVFQLVDDLLGIWGDSAVTGKPAGADLRRRKKSLPVVAALTSGTPASRRLAALYHRAEPLGQAEADTAARLVEEAGGRSWARAEVVRQRARALDALASAAPEPAGERDLTALADLLACRDL